MDPSIVLVDRAEDSHTQMMMLASPNGRCYLFDTETGRISWYVDTGEQFMHVANIDGGVDDYLGLKSQDTNWPENKTNLYHFRPNNIPKLIPFDTKLEIQQYVDHHYEDSLTKVDITKKVYHFNLAGKKADDTSPGAAFKIERQDFYLQRSSPNWSLRFARIRAWFPGFSNQERHQPECVVYHARNSDKFIQACEKYHLHPLPNDSPLNRLMGNFKTNLKISFPEEYKIVAQGKHKTDILEGFYGGLDAIVKRVRTVDDSEATELEHKLLSISCHKNVVTFLGRETVGEFSYYAFERCGLTLAQYVESSPYVEMSDAAMKIMWGLVDGVEHLHTKGFAHMNLNPNNILVHDGTVKICGMWNSKRLSEVQDGVKYDMHNLVHIILYIISDGQHSLPPDVEDVATFIYNYPERTYMDNLKLTWNGRNEEAWYLLEHLEFLGATTLGPIESVAQLKKQPYFWYIPERLGFLKDLSDHLNEGNPTPQLKNEIEQLNMEVLATSQGNWFDLVGGRVPQVANGRVVTDSVLDAMGYKVPKPGGTGRYTDGSIISLLKFSRNYQNHLQGIDANPNPNHRAVLHTELGKNQKELEENLRTKVPLLLTRSHKVVAGHYAQIDFLKKYYL